MQFEKFTHAPVRKLLTSFGFGTVRGFAQRRKPEKKGATAVKPWGSTIKAQEAIQESLSIAQKLHHQQIEPEHLALSLLEQKDGLVCEIIQKLGIKFTKRNQGKPESG